VMAGKASAKQEAAVKNKLLLVTVFALAMGYLEAAVVVYLRSLFYPEGFAFPVRMMDVNHAVIELFREAATVVMLLAVAFIAETTRRGRLACFMLLFGVWDLAYYLFLRVTISWPESLLTWDLLFLIPVIWTGPVLAPMLVSVLLIAAGLVYYTHREASETVMISSMEWLIAIGGAVVIFVSFSLNHAAVYSAGVPQRFAWEIFGVGLAMGIAALANVVRRITSQA
jgi:hypothetical protein